MVNCGECAFIFMLPEDADDYKQGKGDCVTEKKDEKRKYWLSKPVFENGATCSDFKKS